MKCPAAVGVKGTESYYTRNQLRCFTKKKAPSKAGFVSKEDPTTLTPPYSGRWSFETTVVSNNCGQEYSPTENNFAWRVWAEKDLVVATGGTGYVAGGFIVPEESQFFLRYQASLPLCEDYEYIR